MGKVKRNEDLKAAKIISRIIRLNLEDSENYPTEKVFADATARAIIDNLKREGWSYGKAKNTIQVRPVKKSKV